MQRRHAHAGLFCVLVISLWKAELVAAMGTNAEPLLVFVSAFAPGDQGGIHALHLNPETGHLEEVHRTTGIEHPFFIALSPDRRFLYSIHAPGEFGGRNHEFVASFRLEGRSGRLQKLNQQSARGTAACYLDVDATGRSVLLANYSTGSVVSYGVKSDGSLGESVSFVQHSGSSVNQERQQEAHAHCFVIAPDNRFAFAADLGLDQILSYRLNPESSELGAAPQAFVRTPPGAGPRHLTFHPGGRWMYVINELTNSVTLFDYAAESGFLIERQTISTLPVEFQGTSYCADLKVTPDGRFLYGTNRGHDSVAVYRLADDGRLTLVEIQPSGGKGPQNLAITPDGRHLLCANMPGHGVVVFRINPESGEIAPVGDPLGIPSPSCIRIFEQ